MISFSGANLGRGAQGARAPPLIFLEKNFEQAKQYKKHNANKIYQIEPRLKEITCLMTIGKTKKTFSAFQFFHKRYWNSSSGKLI